MYAFIYIYIYTLFPWQYKSGVHFSHSSAHFRSGKTTYVYADAHVQLQQQEQEQKKYARVGCMAYVDFSIVEDVCVHDNFTAIIVKMNELMLRQ